MTDFKTGGGGKKLFLLPLPIVQSEEHVLEYIN